MNKQGRWNLTDSQQCTPQTREGRKEKQNQITLAWGSTETRKGLIKTSREGDASESFQMRKWGGGEDRRVAEIFKHFCSIFFASDDIINPPAGLLFNTIDCLRRAPSQSPLSLLPTERILWISTSWEGAPFEPWSICWVLGAAVTRRSARRLELTSANSPCASPLWFTPFLWDGWSLRIGRASGQVLYFFWKQVGKEVGDKHTTSWLGIQRKL